MMQVHTGLVSSHCIFPLLSSKACCQQCREQTTSIYCMCGQNVASLSNICAFFFFLLLLLFMIFGLRLLDPWKPVCNTLSFCCLKYVSSCQSYKMFRDTPNVLFRLNLSTHTDTNSLISSSSFSFCLFHCD